MERSNIITFELIIIFVIIIYDHKNQSLSVYHGIYTSMNIYELSQYPVSEEMLCFSTTSLAINWLVTKQTRYVLLYLELRIT